jgi:C_GCAxxG_C_C family probable redox protein
MEDAGCDIGKNAVSYFAEGFSCAESVAKALSEALGLDTQNAVRTATPFSGGIAGQGYLCGAVSGALIGLGLSKGRVTSKDDRTPCNKAARKFVDEFLCEFSSLSCKDIIGVDLLTAEGHKEHKEHLRDEKCRPIVKFAAERMYGLIKSPG